MAISGVGLAIAMTVPACKPSRHGPLLAGALELKVNTLDGCTACGCRVPGQLRPGDDAAWWATFGVVSADDQSVWKASASSSHCGLGSFETVSSHFERTVGTPYLILDLATSASIAAEGRIQLAIHARIQKLSAFDHGQPVYADTTEDRVVGSSGEGDIAFPLLVADAREKESFAIHEVLVRLGTKLLGSEPAASYGAMSVSADVPGAEIRLDGGLVGRVVEGKPILLENVLAGKREVLIRDFSGREAQREVAVQMGKTVEVTLKVLGGSAAQARQGLVPIGKNPQGHEEYWRVHDGAMVVSIPAGEFSMGSPDAQGDPDERPLHRVKVAEFLIDKTEVTWRQFRQFGLATRAPLPPAPVWGTPDDYPAAFVLWDEAKAYCAWAGGRLPTEAEWEKAARGPDGRKYSWGNDWDATRCNSISGGPHEPRSVGSFPDCVSPYGALDMSGGMWEWCADYYGERTYAEGPTQDPQGPTTGQLRVLRGGAWMSQPMWLRVAYRAKGAASSRNADHGFRCAQAAPR